jgi:hypothetical protein
MMDYRNKFRFIKPGSPYLHGMVEKSRLTDLKEYYSIVNLDSKRIVDKLF